MSHQFYDFKTLTQGSASMVELIKQLYKDGSNEQRLVLPPVQPGFLRSALSQEPPEKGCNLSQLLYDTKQHIYPGIMLWQSPKYFGYFPSSIAVTNVLAEMFTTTFHSPAFNYALSPSHTELENIVTDWSALALGLPSKFLIQNSGGSIINTSTTQSILVTIHAAKHKKMDELNIKQGQNQQNLQKIVKFVGYFGHFSFVGNQRGLKLKQIFYRRAIPVYYCQKIKNLVIDTEKFEKIVQDDVDKGLIPFWYGGTYGTTFSCANDLNPQVIRICKKHGMWINIDAAYLGSRLICPEMRPNMKLFQEIDSITVNFSKALFLGNGGSLLFISDKQVFTKSMGSEIKFSFYKNQYTGLHNVIDYKDWMLGLNRRNNSLKFYYLFKHYGLEQLRAYLRQTVQKADHLVARVQKSGIFKLFSKPQLGLVCFQLCDKDGKPSSQLTKLLEDKIKNINQGFSSAGHFKQYNILRFVIGNSSSTIEVIDKYYDQIEKQGYKILKESVQKKQ